MISLKWIRDHLLELDSQLTKRGMNPIGTEIAKLDSEKRQLITLIQQLQSSRNEKSKTISQVKDKDNSKFTDLREEMGIINKNLEELESKLRQHTRLNYLLERIPNILSDDVHLGTFEEDNKVVRTWGDLKSGMDFKEHFEIGEKLGIMDFEQSAKISGSRFVTLFGQASRLERALANFMLDVNTKEFGFTEVSPPYLVKQDSMYNSGHLPKFSEDSFVTTCGYRLIPTSEVSLVNLVSDAMLQEEKLPIRFTAYTPCFRSEAGSAGKDNRGMIRLHQFNKVEMVSVTTPENSSAEHEIMIKAAETILQKLKLPYRVVLLCSGETGFASSKTYDLEVWLPGQKKYREISSCSNCTDFQSRRMNARYRDSKNEIRLVHTLNASGLAVGRAIVAIMENYQNNDGSFNVPEVLVDYMGGIKKIE